MAQKLASGLKVVTCINFIHNTFNRINHLFKEMVCLKYYTGKLQL